MDELGLLPLPRRLRRTGGAFDPRRPLAVAAAALSEPVAEALLDALRAAGARPARTEGAADVSLAVDPGAVLERTGEAYRLEVTPTAVRVAGADAAGLAHGARTLAQLLGAAGPDGVPALEIDDAPAFPHRGLMLDVSRDRVPTMETLYGIVDRLAAWKGNELQLYVEHTFAYAGHEEVWRGASPLTPDDVRELDAYCAARHVRLVPNQQSFGHLHAWLRHPRYRHLAECPEGVEHPFLSVADAREREPFSLCPTDPRSLAFVGELLDQLLPCFRADEVNVGCDETFDLGQGRSRAAVAERGVGRVWLDYLLGLRDLARERGRRLCFWADVLLTHPELVPELPRDGSLTALLWGYEADHPFADQCARLAAADLPFRVCPGTSSWQSLAGRFTNAMENVAAAVKHGRAAGAEGVLVTDWGDRGHLQPLTASFPGWLAAADLSWNADAPAERRSPEAVATLVSRHVLDEPEGERGGGRALVGLARAGEACGAKLANASPLSLVLTKPHLPFPPPECTGLRAAGLERAIGTVEGALTLWTAAAPRAPDGALCLEELRWSAGAMRFAALLGLQRLHAPGPDVAALPADARAPLAAELEALLEEHGRLWLRRSRPGGLDRSRAWLERVLALLRA